MLASRRAARRSIGVAIAWLLFWPPVPGSLAQAPGLPSHPPAAALDRYGEPLPRGAVFRLGTVKYRQGSSIYRITFTPDGKQFITDGEDSILRVWDAAEGRLIRRIDPQVGVLHDYQLTTRGHRIMAMGTAHEPDLGFVQQVVMVDLDNGQVTDRAIWKDDLNQRMGAFALCPDRQYVAVEWGNEGIRVLDAWSEAEIVRFDTGDRPVDRIVFSRDGRRLAAETHDGAATARGQKIQILDVAEKRALRTLREPGFPFNDLAFSPDASTLAAAEHSTLFIWDVETGEKRPYYYARIGPMSYSADGRLIAGIGIVGRLGVFDLQERRMTLMLETKGVNPTTAALSPDGKTLITNGGATVLHAWDLQARRDRFAMPEAHTSPPTTAIVTPDGQTIITADERGSVRLWDARDGRQIQRWQCPGVAQPPILAPDGTLLQLANEPLERATLTQWEFSRGREPVTRPIPAMRDGMMLRAAGFGDEGRSFLVLNTLGVIRGWNLAENQPRDMPQLRFERRHRDEGLREVGVMVTSAAFVPGGRTLAVSTIMDGTQMFDTATGRALFVAPDAHQVVASADGRILATAEFSGNVAKRTRSMLMARAPPPRHGVPPRLRRHQTPRCGDRQVVPSDGCRGQ